MPIAVFARAPVAGAVKTRLIPLLGAEGAASLHRRLVRHALATAQAARLGPVQLWCAPDTQHPFFAECAAEFGVALREQPGGDLGDRMRGAFASALPRSGALLLIGADCPALTSEDLREAARRLAQCEAVFVPAEDGGYVLVGLAAPLWPLFEGIAWGTSSVMQRTRERLEAAGTRWCSLRMLWDIDRPADYRRLREEGLVPDACAR